MNFVRASVLLFAIGLFGCSNNHVFEDYAKLPDNMWHADSVQSFQFEVKDDGSSLDLFITLKNSLDYSYHNLFVDYKLYNLTSGEEVLVEKGLKDFTLFNPRTGKPFGSGSSGWYDHLLPLKTQYVFEDPGQYEIRLQHYMRVESLQEIAAVGFVLTPYVEE